MIIVTKRSTSVQYTKKKITATQRRIIIVLKILYICTHIKETCSIILFVDGDVYAANKVALLLCASGKNELQFQNDNYDNSRRVERHS